MSAVPRLDRIIVALSAVCLPVFAHAEDIEIWSFSNRNMPAEATSQQLDPPPQLTNEGLRIETMSDGYIVWQNKPLPGPADVITLRLQSNQAMEAALIWPANPSNPDQLVQLFFVVEPSESFQDVDVIMSDYPEWDWQTEKFGIAFPAGTSVVIESMTFRHWAWSEKLIEGWKTFWTFDEFRPYSINFLWGPLITTNEPARVRLFDTLPPIAWSAVRIFFAIILVAGIGAIVYGITSKNNATAKLQAIVFFGYTCIAVWIVFDVRMGLELLRYAQSDIASYVLPEPDEKTLRTHASFYSVADAFLPTIRLHDRYALIAPADSPFFANLRYMGYPSVPVTDMASMSGMTLIAVIDRADITMNAESRLVDGNGTVLSLPGRITRRIGVGNFLFETE